MALITTSISGSSGSIGITGSMLADASGYGNSASLGTDITFLKGYNTMFVGPISVEEGISFIISDGSLVKII